VTATEGNIRGVGEAFPFVRAIHIDARSNHWCLRDASHFSSIHSFDNDSVLVNMFKHTKHLQVLTLEPMFSVKAATALTENCPQLQQLSITILCESADNIYQEITQHAKNLLSLRLVVVMKFPWPSTFPRFLTSSKSLQSDSIEYLHLTLDDMDSLTWRIPLPLPATTQLPNLTALMCRRLMFLPEHLHQIALSFPKLELLDVQGCHMSETTDEQSSRHLLAKHCKHFHTFIL
jgi:hypothetical protein